ncbi:unnamed protein product [Moneuplotes crassus]|uniref:Uncharacterized protein n=1 Tax=Euplotes crassus TaxID=5936 RepID=A0AAD1U5V8_EUPCR|nr:unnamed protein product [Moneuplotes crassus]
MKYDRNTLYNNPFSFDCPPPQYDFDQLDGWTAITRAIISPKKSFQRYVKHARRWNQLDRDYNDLQKIRNLSAIPVEDKCDPHKARKKSLKKGSRSYKPCLLSQQSRLLHRNGRKCKSKKKLLVSSCDQISKILKIPKEVAKPPCRNRAFSADKLCPNKKPQTSVNQNRRNISRNSRLKSSHTDKADWNKRGSQQPRKQLTSPKNIQLLLPQSPPTPITSQNPQSTEHSSNITSENLKTFKKNSPFSKYLSKLFKDKFYKYNRNNNISFNKKQTCVKTPYPELPERSRPLTNKNLHLTFKGLTLPKTSVLGTQHKKSPNRPPISPHPPPKPQNLDLKISSYNKSNTTKSNPPHPQKCTKGIPQPHPTQAPSPSPTQFRHSHTDPTWHPQVPKKTFMKIYSRPI